MIKVKGRAFCKEPWYGSYHSMMDRCYRTQSANYKFYGGRGIAVCTEWHDIEVFEKWCAESGHRKGLSLDRIDPDGDYCPGNCRWTSSKEQANNRRNTVYIEHNGERKTISQWADTLGMKRSTISDRYYRGFPIEKVLSVPTQRRRSCHAE